MAQIKPLRILTGFIKESALTDTLLINNVQGDIAPSGSLTLSSTSGSPKGAINIGTGGSFYSEVFNYLKLITAGLGATPNILSGMYLSNTTVAAAGAQQISPSVTWEGQGWQTTTPGSQSVKFQSYVLPVQAATNPTATWILQSSINAAAFVTAVTVTSVGAMAVTSSISAGGGGQGGNSLYTSPNGFAMILAPTGANSVNLGVNAAKTTGCINFNNSSFTSITDWYNTAGTNIMRFLNNGNLLVGTTTDNGARLQVIGGKTSLAATTATYGSLNIPSGTVPTTLVNGDMYQNGTNLFYVRSGTTQENVFTGNPGATAPTTSVQLVLLTNVVGTATFLLSTPNSWGSVVLNGTTYKVPLYT